MYIIFSFREPNSEKPLILKIYENCLNVKIADHLLHIGLYALIIRLL